MSPTDFLQALRLRGALVCVDGGELEIEAPPEVLKPQVLEMARTLKPQLLELLQAEVATREYSEPTATAQNCAVEPAPDDGLQRVGPFIAPRLNDAAYRAHWETKSASTPDVADLQAQRIRRLSAEISAEELLAAYKRIKPALKKSLNQTDLHELALTMADLDRQANATTEEPRDAIELLVSELYQPQPPAKEMNS